MNLIRKFFQLFHKSFIGHNYRPTTSHNMKSILKTDPIFLYKIGDNNGTTSGYSGPTVHEYIVTSLPIFLNKMVSIFEKHTDILPRMVIDHYP